MELDDFLGNEGSLLAEQVVFEVFGEPGTTFGDIFEVLEVPERALGDLWETFASPGGSLGGPRSLFHRFRVSFWRPWGTIL